MQVVLEVKDITKAHLERIENLMSGGKFCRFTLLLSLREAVHSQVKRAETKKRTVGVNAATMIPTPKSTSSSKKRKRHEDNEDENEDELGMESLGRAVLELVHKR